MGHLKSMHDAALAGCCAAVMFLVTGCNGPVAPAAPPPLKASFRSASIPGKGLVVGLNNTSSSETVSLGRVFVRSENEDHERPYSLSKTVGPLDSVSIGWMELDGWKLKKGDRLRFVAAGYPMPLEVVVE